MSHDDSDNFFLRAATLLLWNVFLFMGLFPEYAFFWLREQGHVATQHALINSYHILTIALALYMGLFIERRCLGVGLPPWAAQARGAQAALLSMLAFLPVYIQDFFIYMVISQPQYRYFLIIIIVMKCLSWLYLYQLIFRYYLISGEKTFLQMRLLFFFVPKSQNASEHPVYPER